MAKRARGNSCVLTGLPVDLAQKVSTFLLPFRVAQGSDLTALVQSYPVKYLSVEMKWNNETDLDGILEGLRTAPGKLKEVAVTCVSYEPGNQETIDKLLQLKLNCFALYFKHLSSTGFPRFVQNCCQSHNKRHFLNFKFGTCEADRIGTGLVKLLREDEALVLLDAFCYTTSDEDRCLRGLQSPVSMSLQHLRLSGVRFCLNEATALSTALASNCRLLTLEISLERVGSREFEVLGKGIARSHTLSSFSLSSDIALALPIDKFASSLTSNRTLESLMFENVEIGKKAGIALSKLLQVNNSLRLLWLIGCGIGPLGCHCIVDSILQNNCLEDVCLTGCGIAEVDHLRLCNLERSPWRVPKATRKIYYYETLPSKVLWVRDTGSVGLQFRLHELWLNQKQAR